MTPPDAAALRALAEKATPGPWAVITDRYDPVIVKAGADWPHGDDDALGTAYGRPDAALIVAAVNALPGLLDENEELRARLVTLEAENQRLRYLLGRGLNIVNRLAAERDSLRIANMGYVAKMVDELAALRPVGSDARDGE